MVDFRREEAVLVRNFEDEVAEVDSRSDLFPNKDGEGTEGDFAFRDAVEMEGVVESFRREVTLESVVLVGAIRPMDPSIGRVLGRRGDFEATVVGGLVVFLNSTWGSDLVSTKMASTLIF